MRKEELGGIEQREALSLTLENRIKFTCGQVACHAPDITLNIRPFVPPVLYVSL